MSMRLHQAAAVMLREIGMVELAERFETNSLTREAINAMTFPQMAALAGIMVAIGYDDDSLLAVSLALDQRAGAWLDKLDAADKAVN